MDDVLIPPIGMLLDGRDFSQLGIVLGDASQYSTVEEAVAAGVPVIRYGAFLNTVVNILLIALALFLVIRGYNNLRRRFQGQGETTDGPPPAPSREEVLLAEIRDLLAERRGT